MENSAQEIERLYMGTKEEWEMHYGVGTFNASNWNPRTDVPVEHWHDKVEELDLDTFAQMIEENGHGKWLVSTMGEQWCGKGGRGWHGGGVVFGLLGWGPSL